MSADKQMLVSRITLFMVLLMGAEGVLSGVCGGKNNSNWPVERDAKKWPFSSDSIWNMPIGCNAKYVFAKLERPKVIDIDNDYFIITSNKDPRVPVYQAGGTNTSQVYGAGAKRCVGSTPLGSHMKVNFPVNLVMPSRGTNNSMALLLPDGVTIRQMNAFARCKKGGPIYGLNRSFTRCTESIKGSGNKCAGGHGGSGLSSIGGTLRKWDFINDEPIRHALKINLRPWQMYRSTSGKKCEKRWPARNCDNYAQKYKSKPAVASSKVRALRYGALLALNPNETYASLGVTTAAGKKFFDVLQDYGAYLVDGSGGGKNNDIRNSFSGTEQVESAFKAKYGFPLIVGKGKRVSGGEYEKWQNEMRNMISHLYVVDDNGPSSIGGKGKNRRRPLAPGFVGGGGEGKAKSVPKPPVLINISN